MEEIKEQMLLKEEMVAEKQGLNVEKEKELESEGEKQYEKLKAE